jgi:hypothetical protein
MSPLDRDRAQDSTDPPGAVSNQNHEEAEAGHADPGEDSGSVADVADEADEAGDSVPGAASEGSQATGHPENAG